MTTFETWYRRNFYSYSLNIQDNEEYAKDILEDLKDDLYIEYIVTRYYSDIKRLLLEKYQENLKEVLYLKVFIYSESPEDLYHNYLFLAIECMAEKTSEDLIQLARYQ